MRVSVSLEHLANRLIAGDPITDGGGNSLLYCAPPIPKPNTCPTDINGDGVTNVLDLTMLLLAWGPCS